MSLFLYLLLAIQAINVSSQCIYISQTFTTYVEVANGLNNCLFDFCTFIDISSNALSIGTSNVTIRNCHFLNIDGKAIIFKDNIFTKNILIENNNFENINSIGIFVKNHSNIIIQNNKFNNISGQAIVLRTLATDTSNNTIIRYNNISNIIHHGILCGPNHKNVLIIGNIMYNIGTNSSLGTPRHGIIVQGPNFKIIANKVFNMINKLSNSISVKSYGLISGNILFDNTKRAILYYSEQRGYNGTLIIENNFMYNNGESAAIATSGVDTQIEHIKLAIIRFNTVITSIGQYAVSCPEYAIWECHVYGNILIKPDGNIISQYITINTKVISTCNLETYNITDINFIKYDINQSADIDLHIASNISITYGYCNGLNLTLPIYDIDGNIRGENNRIDVGADRWMPPTISPTTAPTLYPSDKPTLYPSNYPTLYPTLYPSNPLTVHPTLYPSKYPTLFPSFYPSLNPTIYHLDGKVNDDTTTTIHGFIITESEDIALIDHFNDVIVIIILSVIGVLILLIITSLYIIYKRNKRNTTNIEVSRINSQSVNEGEHLAENIKQTVVKKHEDDDDDMYMECDNTTQHETIEKENRSDDDDMYVDTKETTQTAMVEMTTNGNDTIDNNMTPK